jgi:predicted esterase
MEVEMNKTYRTLVEITDFGPFVSKIILPVASEVKKGEISKEHFMVYVERKHQKTGELIMDCLGWGETESFPSKGYIEIQDAYPADEEGNRVEVGTYITLIMPTMPFFRLTSKLAIEGYFNTYCYNDFAISQVKEIKTANQNVVGLFYDQCIQEIMLEKEGWINSCSTNEKMPLKYGYFSPRIGSGKRPLIIWLHGGGEGGQDPVIAYTSNQVTNLAKKNNQQLFGGAYILAPQSPTMWMDDGTEIIGKEGKSIYIEAVKALIDEFISLHDDIDIQRIYIGGCSNGGFLTMRMIIEYPDFFRAAYPVCQALFDDKISDDELKRIKDIPIWFTHSKDDAIVDPEKTVIPTYKRLIALGSKDVHLSYFDQVIDSRGYVYENFGHASWIQMLNDDCRLDYDGKPVLVDGEEVSLLQWLAKKG